MYHRRSAVVLVFYCSAGNEGVIQVAVHVLEYMLPSDLLFYARWTW